MEEHSETSSMNEENDITESVSTAVQEIRRTLELGKSSFAENANDFAFKNYGVLCGAISAYGQLFTNAKKSGRQELEESWSKVYCKPNVREAVDQLLEIEDEWDDFLLEVDQSTSQAHVGSKISCDFINLESFVSNGCQVHIVSFGTPDGALIWKKQTGCKLPVWSNEDRSFYHFLGFKRSISQVWKSQTMMFYGEQLSRNVSIPQPLTDYQDDPLQMGGNAILNSNGQVVYVYSSKHPADRPQLPDLLEALISNASPT